MIEGLALLEKATEQAGYALPFEILHREVQLAPLAAELVHLHDVGMADPGDDARLVEEHVDQRLFARQVREDPLDHHDPLEPARADQPPEEDLRHPARSELTQDVVATDFLHQWDLHPPSQAIRGA